MRPQTLLVTRWQGPDLLALLTYTQGGANPSWRMQWISTWGPHAKLRAEMDRLLELHR